MTGVVTGAGPLETIALVFTRRFWTFRAVNALLGVLLTIGAGVAQLSVGDRLRDRMDALDAAERAADQRIRTIDTAVFEFKLFETDATLVQILTLTDAIRPEVRDQVRAISIMNRRHAFLVILSELHTDPAAFTAKMEEYDRLSQGSIAWDRKMADAMIAMESESIQAAHQLQQDLLARMYDARAERLALASRLDRYTTIGSTIQMAGLLLVLIGNLLADHLGGRRRGGTTDPPSSAVVPVTPAGPEPPAPADRG
jgi:hypothetical protein